MHYYWKSDTATKFQINYINGLMEAKEEYLLNVDLNNLSKVKASNLIQDLLYETNDNLVAKKILKLKINLKSLENDKNIRNLEENSSMVAQVVHVSENERDISPTVESHTKIKYKVTGKLHLWGWTNFKEEINGRIIDYNTTGNVIDSITYEVESEIKNVILQKYGLSAERIG